MRTFSYQATILSVKHSGENNSRVTLLTREEGIIYAILYGGPKSKLRSLVSPFNTGIAYIYKDELKKSSKITDFDVKSYHPSFRENLFKSYAANFAGEILLKSKCAGSAEQTFILYNALLDGMEASNENESKLGLLRFIWRYIDLLGVRPDSSCCCQCGKSFMQGKLNDESLDCWASYSEIENGFICNDCLNNKIMPFCLSKKSLTYLEAVSVLKPKDVRNIAIDLSSMVEIKELCYSLIQVACNTTFLSLQSGIGIL